MSCEKFNVGSVRQHRDGIHAERVIFEDGVLTMAGRKIPVRSPEQLEKKLKEIGCREEIIEGIVENLFGIAVAAEAPVAVSELSQSLV